MAHELVQFVESQRQQFCSVVSDKSIEFDREAAFAVQIITGSDYLLGIALNNKEALRNAVINVAAVGITLNPASKLAYLVPRKGKVCLDISYMGLLHIAQQCGAIRWGQSAIVRANDTFELQGIDAQPIHRYNPFASDRGEIVGVYVVVKTEEGDYLTHPMPISRVWDIRGRSEAWKAFVEKKKSCPWVTDEEEMIKKTCIKQAAKMWPRRDRLDSAVHYLDTEGNQGIELSEKGSLPDEEYDGFKKSIEAALTKEKAKSEWQAAVKACEKIGDLGSAQKLKEVLLAHGRFIDSVAVEEKAS